MKQLILIAASFGLALTASAEITNRADFAPVAACIDQYAADVEKVEISLKDASDFLTNYVCAEVLAERDMKQQTSQQKLLANYFEACGEMPEGEEGSCQVGVFLDPAEQLQIPRLNDRPADATAYASQKLLDLRLARISGDN